MVVPAIVVTASRHNDATLPCVGVGGWFRGQIMLAKYSISCNTFMKRIFQASFALSVTGFTELTLSGFEELPCDDSVSNPSTEP